MNALRCASRFAPSALLLTALSLALGACGAAVNPLDTDGGRDGSAPPRGDGSAADAPVTPPPPPPPPGGCVLPDGTRIAVGASAPAPDGCNRCTCQADGALACTELACVDAGTTDPPVVNCDPRVLCNSPAPACPRGTTNSVPGACWGECVPIRSCAELECDPRVSSVRCPQNMYCDSRSNRCREDAPGGG